MRCASFIENDDRWTQGRLRWDHVVVLPNAEIADDFALPECPRWKVIDRNDLPTLVDKLKYVLLQQELDRPLLTQQGIDQLVNRVERQGFTATQRRRPRAGQRGRRRRADRTSGRHPRRHPTAEPRRDPRGSGQRQDVPRRGAGPPTLREGPARRAGLLLPRPGVLPGAHHRQLERAATNRPTSASSTTSASCGVHPKGPTKSLRSDETVQFWEHDLPLQMAELAAQLEPGHRFDSIVVDEAQDFADAWWDPLLAALKDDETGGIYVFTDEGQRVFNRHGSPPVPLVPLVLDHNLRNTRQIANAFQPLVDHPMRFLGGEGPAVKFVACARDDAMDAGDDEVELLLEEGWRPEDVALLTTGTRHPEQKERQAAGSAAYWDSFWDAEQVFYGHVLGFKGLERRAVVLVVNEESAFERSRERLYVGLSRARDQLVVCGDPDFIREVGGPDLAHRLNLPPG